LTVTADGVPIRCWTFPANTADTAIIRRVKDDLTDWNLHRLVWVADRGFASAANRGYLTRGGGHYIHAEKLRSANSEAAAALARPGRYRTVAGNLRVKEVRVAPGGGVGADADGVRAERFVVCANPEQANRDRVVRQRLITHLQSLIDGSDGWTAQRRDELVGTLTAKPGLRRYLRRTRAGLLRIDKAAATREAHLDGQVAAAHLRPDADRRRSGRRLQAADSNRTRLARPEELARAAPGVPLPRGPHPRPHPTVLAGSAAHSRRGKRHP